MLVALGKRKIHALIIANIVNNFADKTLHSNITFEKILIKTKCYRILLSGILQFEIIIYCRYIR